MSIPIENRASLPQPTFAPLAAILADQRTMKYALDWMMRQTPPLAPTDVVTQDEFSHDILVEYPGGLFLVYDVS